MKYEYKIHAVFITTFACSYRLVQKFIGVYLQVVGQSIYSTCKTIRINYCHDDMDDPVRVYFPARFSNLSIPKKFSLHHVFGIRNIEYFVFGGNISSIWEPNLTLGTWNGGCILPFLVVKLLGPDPNMYIS